MLEVRDISAVKTREEGRKVLRVFRNPGKVPVGYLDVTRFGDCFWKQSGSFGMTTAELEFLVGVMKAEKLAAEGTDFPEARG